MAIPTFKAGAYGVTLAGVSLGVTEVGFECVMRPSMVPIRCDVTGRTPVDAIWTGVEDVIVRMESIEWITASANWYKAIHWFKNSAEGEVRVAGTLVTSLAEALILTPVVTGSGATYNFHKAYSLEPIRSVFSSQRLRTIPMGFYCLAYDVDASTFVATVYHV